MVINYHIIVLITSKNHTLMILTPKGRGTKTAHFIGSFMLHAIFNLQTRCIMPYEHQKLLPSFPKSFVEVLYSIKLNYILNCDILTN